MDVNPGYKQTEVGMIPEDWDVSSLRNCCSKITDGTHDTPKPVRAGIPFLTAIHVKDNWIDYNSCLYVTEADHAVIFSRCNPEKNDVLMVNIGAGVATTALVNVDYEFSLKNVALLKPDSRQSVGAYLNYSLAQRKSTITQGLSSGGAQPFLSLKQIGEISIPLPPTKAEQRAIAAALSDVDALIAALDRLIAKKRDIKQAAMHELLTGKRRLPGFAGENGYKQTDVGLIPEDWTVRRLGEVVEFLDGQRRPVKDSDRAKMRGDFPYYGASGIIDYVNNFIFDEDLILLGEDGENILSRNCRLAFRVSGKIWVNNHAHVLRPRTGIDIVYLTEYLESIDYEQYNTGTAQPKLNKQICSNIPVLCQTHEEQHAIALVLSEADAEIAALDAQCNKTKLIKQGMMQELLTGRIRLV